MTTITEKLASSLRAMIELAEQEVASLHELGRDDEDTEAQADDAQVSLDAARTTLAEYEATRYGVRIPEEFARKTLADYNAEIATGTVNYPFYAGAFSQLVRGVVE